MGGDCLALAEVYTLWVLSTFKIEVNNAEKRKTSLLRQVLFLKNLVCLPALPLLSSPSDQTGMWWECAHPVGQRTHVPVGTRAEPPPAGAVPRGDSEAEAAPAHAEEPRLCRQLPGQASVPAWGPGAAKDGAPEGGGEARGWERWNEERVGGARRAPGRPPEICQGPGGRRGPPAGHSPAP